MKIYTADKMRAVIQRVQEASVIINGTEKRSIAKGIVVFLGITHTDTAEDVHWLCGKISKLRIFNDDKGIMNLSVVEQAGDIMLISQFTLHASIKKGNRPSYIHSSPPGHSLPLYHYCIQSLASACGKEIITGEFGADMQVALINDGPVTILMDSKNPE